MRLFIAACALALSSSAGALTSGTPVEYDGVQWSVAYNSNTTGLYSGCTTLNGTVISTFHPGALATLNFNLVCGSTGNYPGTTTAYIGASSEFLFTLPVGGYFWNCAIGLSTLSGTCALKDSFGNTDGSITLTFVH